MKAKSPKDIMRGVAQAFGCAVEFEGEVLRVYPRIIRETLPPAKQCGMGTKPRGKA